MDLGKKIRAHRDELGLTQAELADKLGLTYSSVSQWESGRATPRTPILRQLADLFDTTVAELMGETPEHVRPNGAQYVTLPVLVAGHAGEFTDEFGPDEVEVPASIADAHPRGFMVHAQGGCMDNRFPHDALLLVDPDMEPVNGQPVLAETSDYGAVVRNYTRGRSTVMLTADSHSGEYDDILAGPGDEPVVCKGRVVWYMGERDER